MKNELAKFSPDLTYSLSVMEDGIKYDINVHKVGKITKFYPDKLTVDVQVLSKFNIQDNVTDYAVLLDLPLIIDGAIDTHLTFGDITGSECLIHFNDTDIDAWYETGEKYTPPSLRLHNISDGFATLRPHSQTNLFPYDMEGTVLNKGNNIIKLTGNEISSTVSNSQLKVNENAISISTHTASITIDTLIELKNTSQSLAVLIQEFITACENIQVNNAAPIPLTDASRAAFTQLKSKFQGLLK